MGNVVASSGGFARRMSLRYPLFVGGGLLQVFFGIRKVRVF
jgi:hypothetical protein